MVLLLLSFVMLFCLFIYLFYYYYLSFLSHHLTTGKAGPSRVGDGGASWRLKALARAKNQATDTSDPNYGRRVGDIVSEQWGSLAELTAGLTDTRAAHGKLAKKINENLHQIVHIYLDMNSRLLYILLCTYTHLCMYIYIHTYKWT